MTNQFYITEDSFNRAKKQLKKTLQNNDIQVSLSQCANFLAKSFGYSDEHHIQKMIKQNTNFYIKTTENKEISNEEYLFDRLNIEYKYLRNILFIWSRLCDYMNMNLVRILKILDNKISKEKSIRLFEITNQIRNTYELLGRKKPHQGHIELPKKRCYNIVKFKDILDELIDFFELFSEFCDHSIILGNLLIEMGRTVEIEEYFYLDAEQKNKYYLQPDDFDGKYYEDDLGFCKINKKTFDHCNDILILGEYSEGVPILGTYIKELIRKEQNQDVDLIDLSHDTGYKLQENNVSNRKRIYIAYKKNDIYGTIHNFEDLKKFLEKRNSGRTNFEDISLFLEVVHKKMYNKTKITYKKIEFK